MRIVTALTTLFMMLALTGSASAQSLPGWVSHKTDNHVDRNLDLASLGARRGAGPRDQQHLFCFHRRIQPFDQFSIGDVGFVAHPAGEGLSRC